MTYEQAREDHLYLWEIAPARDMTGGYVDSDDLAKLLSNPCKRVAKECLIRQIHYWFEAGPEFDFPIKCRTAAQWAEADPGVAEIAKRHGIQKEAGQ